MTIGDDQKPNLPDPDETQDIEVPDEETDEEEMEEEDDEIGVEAGASPEAENEEAGTEEPAEAEESPEAEATPAEEQTSLTPEFCRRVEAILFTSEQPISAHRIAGVLKAKDGMVKAAIHELAAQYSLEKHAFGVIEVAGGFQVLTRPEFGDLIAKLYEQGKQSRLSVAALETLAIIAYKQPVMRVAVEDIRGVGVQPVLKSLLDMGLVRVVGRADALGRPLLYGTTQKFLITFGLKSPKDLPSIEDLKAGEQA